MFGSKRTPLWPLSVLVWLPTWCVESLFWGFSTPCLNLRRLPRYWLWAPRPPPLKKKQPSSRQEFFLSFLFIRFESLDDISGGNWETRHINFKRWRRRTLGQTPKSVWHQTLGMGAKRAMHQCELAGNWSFIPMYVMYQQTIQIYILYLCTWNRHS